VSKHWSVNAATDEEIHFFIDRVEALLEAKGIKVDHPAFREVLKKAGARESANGYLTFPRELQRESLALAPRSFLISGMTPEYNLQIPHPGGLFYARGPIGQVYYHDALTGDIRTNTMADQQDYIMAQIVGPGTPVLLSAFTYASDMRTLHA
jgi:trimethylamine:corrinoid methyltransferase-like protein